MPLPPVVSPAQWKDARDALLVKEKQATRALDALAAERRRLPVVEFSADYRFQGPAGTVNLAGLFEGRRQLVVYHFMFEPGDEHVCAGCSAFTDSVGHLAHLHARETSFVLVSIASLAELERSRQGWDGRSPGTPARVVPSTATAASAPASGSARSCAAGDRLLRSYFTSGRGVDRLRFDLNVLDLTPLGRQEDWEDSPDGWPQTPAYWWRCTTSTRPRNRSAITPPGGPIDPA